MKLGLVRLVWMIHWANAQVTLLPSGRIVVTLNASIGFSCFLQQSDIGTVESTQWLLNGTLLDSQVAHANVRTDFSFGVGTLDLIPIPVEYNATTIQCTVSINPPRSEQESSSMIVTLLLEGTLSAVGSLTASVVNETVFLGWTAPFSLDSSNPIRYCVNIVNFTSMETLDSECRIIVTNYTYNLPLDSGCNDHIVMVIPENRAGRGALSSILYSQFLPAPQAIESQKSNFVFLNDSELLQYEIVMASPICFAEIILTSFFKTEVTILRRFDLSIMEFSIFFTSAKLARNTYYIGTLNSSNINGSVSTNVNISTHDIIDVKIRSDPLISIQTDYVSKSRATGGLFTFLYVGQNGNTDFNKSVFFCIDKNASLDYMLPIQLIPGAYLVFAYDIEENGLIYNGIANPAFMGSKFFTRNASVPSVDQWIHESEACDITIISTEEKLYFLSALCTHSSMQAGFVMIVQNALNVEQLLVNDTKRGMPMGPVTVQVNGYQNYHVSIFPKDSDSGIVNSILAYSEELFVVMPTTPANVSLPVSTDNHPAEPGISITVSVTVCAVLFAALVFGGIASVLVCCLVKRKSSANAVNKTKTEPATLANTEYAEIGDIKESFSYTRNVLYGMPSQTVKTEMPDPPLSHEYEDVKEIQLKLSNTYHIKQCPAYGVPLHITHH